MTTHEPPDLIRKLAALANHPNTPPAEAAAARRKLDALLAKHGITEEDISSEREILWDIRRIPTHGKSLLLSVCAFILNRCSVPVRLHKNGPHWQASLRTTAADQIDITACFSYYLKILETDRQRIFDEAASLRREARKRLDRAAILSRSTSKLPELMVGKYDLFPQIVRDTVAEMQQRAANNPPPPAPSFKPMTKKEREALEKKWAMDDAALARMSDHDAWEKGESLNGGQFKLKG
jgi:hypothetical protein